jgi:dTDP-4-amino-4,6-dideoxygalactose transaminase
VLSLPIFPELQGDEVDSVVGGLHEALAPDFAATR